MVDKSRRILYIRRHQPLRARRIFQHKIGNSRQSYAATTTPTSTTPYIEIVIFGISPLTLRSELLDDFVLRRWHRYANTLINAAEQIGCQSAAYTRASSSCAASPVSNWTSSAASATAGEMDARREIVCVDLLLRGRRRARRITDSR